MLPPLVRIAWAQEPPLARCCLAGCPPWIRALVAARATGEEEDKEDAAEGKNKHRCMAVTPKEQDVHAVRSVLSAESCTQRRRGQSGAKARGVPVSARPAMPDLIRRYRSTHPTCTPTVVFPIHSTRCDGDAGGADG